MELNTSIHPKTIGGKWTVTSNLQTIQQNALILKLFRKMSLFFKFDFNKLSYV